MAGLAVSYGSWLLGFSSTICVEYANSPGMGGRNGEQDSGSQGGVDQKMGSQLPTGRRCSLG